MPYVTTRQFEGAGHLFLCLPQTEVRRGNSLRLASFDLLSGEAVEFRYLVINIIRMLTPGAVPDQVNTGFGLATVGLYTGSMLSSPLMSLSTVTVGATMLNPAIPRRITTPGRYEVRLFNNTGREAAGAVDLSLVVTGALRIFRL